MLENAHQGNRWLTLPPPPVIKPIYKVTHVAPGNQIITATRLRLGGENPQASRQLKRIIWQEAQTQYEGWDAHLCNGEIIFYSEQWVSQLNQLL